jgi:hypothetical protein
MTFLDVRFPPFPDGGRVRSPDSPSRSELDLFRDREFVVYLDAQVSDRTLKLAVAEKQLAGPEVASLHVEQRYFVATNAERYLALGAATTLQVPSFAESPEAPFARQ